MLLLILSEPDPVAQGVGRILGSGSPTPWRLGGEPVRSVAESVLTVRRPVLHIRDRELGAALPPDLMARVDCTVFPSVHRSKSNTPSLTVHPLGNLTSDYSVGGEPERVNRVSAEIMTSAFRELYVRGTQMGREVTFEATHHGPWLPFPSFFIESGSTTVEWEDPAHHRAIAETLVAVSSTAPPSSPIVIGVGGGHYMPYFKDLVRRRNVAVAHLIPSHHLPSVSESAAREIVAASPGASGVVYARGREREASPFAKILPPIGEKDLPSL